MIENKDKLPNEDFVKKHLKVLQKALREAETVLCVETISEDLLPYPLCLYYVEKADSVCTKRNGSNINTVKCSKK